MNFFRKKYWEHYSGVRYVKGSAVIEMSYIMPLFFSLFVLLVHTVFYYHDKAVIIGAAGETAILGVQAERAKETAYDLEGFFRERTSGKLMYMTEINVSVEEGQEEVTVSVLAQRSFMKLTVYQKARIARPEKGLRQVRWNT